MVRDGALVPAEPEAHELLVKYAQGDQMIADVGPATSERARYQRRKWWMLATIFANHLPVIADKEQASELMLIGARECDWVTDPRTGAMWPRARSIAFENMDEERFDRLWKRVVYYVMTEWMLDPTPELEAALDAFFAGPHERARLASLGTRVVREREAA